MSSQADVLKWNFSPIGRIDGIGAEIYDQPQVAVLQEVRDLVADELSLEDLQGWFGPPEKVIGSKITAHKGFLFSYLLSPVFTNTGGLSGADDGLAQESYAFKVDADTILYYSRWKRRNAGWLPSGIVALRWESSALGEYEKATRAAMNQWELEGAKRLLKLLQMKKAEQGIAPQSATRSDSDPEGDDNPQPESEGRSR